jgi:hypothetical protein
MNPKVGRKWGDGSRVFVPGEIHYNDYTLNASKVGINRVSLLSQAYPQLQPLLVFRGENSHFHHGEHYYYCLAPGDDRDRNELHRLVSTLLDLFRAAGVDVADKVRREL